MRQEDRASGWEGLGLRRKPQASEHSGAVFRPAALALGGGAARADVLGEGVDVGKPVVDERFVGSGQWNPQKQRD